jgi:hypothetical protein
MRTHVTFRHPAEFVPVSEDDGILSITGVEWFLTILRQVPDLELDPDLCQEDWGVVVFARRTSGRFWIGVSMGPGFAPEEDDWIVHVHGATSWLQRLSGAAAPAVDRLAHDLHIALQADPLVADVQWFTQRELNQGHRQGAPTPGAD